MQFRRIFACALLSTAGLWAAERVSAYRAQLAGPSGAIDGVLVTVGDQLVFVDSDQPDQSFAIPRTSVRSLTLGGNGLITCRTDEPVTGPYGASSSVRIRMLDPGTADRFVRWVGVPLSSEEPRTDTVDLGARTDTATSFDVRHDDHSGRLVVTPSGLDFVDITNRNHSKHWAYGELKGIERKGNNELVLHVYNGDDFKLKTGQMMDDVIYNSIADRIVAARQRR